MRVIVWDTVHWLREIWSFLVFTNAGKPLVNDGLLGVEDVDVENALLSLASCFGNVFNTPAISAAIGAPMANSRFRHKGKKPLAQKVYYHAMLSNGDTPCGASLKYWKTFVPVIRVSTPSVARLSANAGKLLISTRNARLSSP